MSMSSFIPIQVSSTKFVVFPFTYVTRGYLNISFSSYHLQWYGANLCILLSHFLIRNNTVSLENSLRSWRYCLSVRLNFWRLKYRLPENPGILNRPQTSVHQCAEKTDWSTAIHMSIMLDDPSHISQGSKWQTVENNGGLGWIKYR